MNTTFRLLIMMLALSLMACGNAPEAFQVPQSTKLNGGTDNGSTQKTPLITEDGEITDKEIEVKTTISGSPELYELAKKQTAEYSKKISANNEERLDKELSDSIFDVQINKVNKTLGIKINLNENDKKNQYDFSYELKTHDKIKNLTKLLYQPRLSAQKENSYNIKITCYNDDCSKANIFLIKCSKSAAGVCDFENPDIKMAGLFYAQTKAYAKVARANGTDSEKTKKISKLLTEESEIIKKSVVVINGPSFSDIKIVSKDKKKEINIHTDNLDTTETEIKAQISGENTNQDLDVTLARNNPETGVLVFDLKEKGKEDQARIYISEKEIQDVTIDQGSPTDTSIQKIEELYQNAYINPLLISERSRATTLKFEKYRHTKKLKEFIDHWSGNTNMNYCNKVNKKGQPQIRGGQYIKKRLKNFFNYSQPLRDTVYSVAEHIDVTTDFFYLTPLESTYVRTPNYEFQISQAEKSSASGPFQITNDTVFDIANKHKVSDVEFNLYKAKVVEQRGTRYIRSLNQNDDRRFFETSALLGARYTKYIIDKFEDPALWPLAYHKGPGGTESLVNRLSKDQKKFNETLLDVDLYTPKSPTSLCHQVEYSLDILAIRFIASDYKKYGFELDENLNDKSLVKTLYRPSGSVLK